MSKKTLIYLQNVYDLIISERHFKVNQKFSMLFAREDTLKKKNII